MSETASTIYDKVVDPPNTFHGVGSTHAAHIINVSEVHGVQFQ
jgi:hypothetical protein